MTSRDDLEPAGQLMWDAAERMKIVDNQAKWIRFAQKLEEEMCSSVDDFNSTTDSQLKSWSIPDKLV